MDKTKWTYINMYINMGGLRTILGGEWGNIKKFSKLKLKRVSMLFQHINVNRYML